MIKAQRLCGDSSVTRPAGRLHRIGIAALLLLAGSGGGTQVWGAQAAPTDRFPELATAYAVLIDGQVLWARNMDAPRAPASLVKLLTAIELLSAGWDARAAVPVSAHAAAAPRSRAGLKQGEALAAGDLLTAMLMQSANDACIALVEHAAVSTAAFAKRINRRAALLGMTHSVFADPCGFDAARQRTTVRDLILLARTAAGNAEIARRSALLHAEVVTHAQRRIVLRNTNLLLEENMGVTGLKTGHTQQAGDCIIALARRSGHEVLVIVLNSSNRWWGTLAAVEQAFLQVHLPTPNQNE